MVIVRMKVVMYSAGRSSLASHDRQRRETEAQSERFAVGPLWKTPCWKVAKRDGLMQRFIRIRVAPGDNGEFQKSNADCETDGGNRW